MFNTYKFEYCENPSEKDASAEDLVALLKEKGLFLSCAESLTGGMIGARIVDVPGASAVFSGSLVTYTERAKNLLLNVRKKTLSGVGAVSAECAAEMAIGTRKKYRSDISVSVTGLAGPGSYMGKPAGLVYIGISYKKITKVYKMDFKGDRREVREQTCRRAVNLLYETLASEGENHETVS